MAREDERLTGNDGGADDGVRVDECRRQVAAADILGECRGDRGSDGLPLVIPERDHLRRLQEKAAVAVADHAHEHRE